MNEHISYLNSVIEKYRKQIEKIKHDCDLICKTIEVLKKEESSGQLSIPFNSPVEASNLSHGKSMSDLIEDILRLNSPAKLTTDDIFNELIRTGYKSKSKNLKGDISTRLSRMEHEQGRIVSAKKGKAKRYSLPPIEKEVTKIKELVDPSKDNPLFPADLEEGGKEL